MHLQTNLLTDRRNNEEERETGRQADSQSERQSVRQTVRETVRQTVRETDSLTCLQSGFRSVRSISCWFRESSRESTTGSDPSSQTDVHR